MRRMNNKLMMDENFLDTISIDRKPSVRLDGLDFKYKRIEMDDIQTKVSSTGQSTSSSLNVFRISFCYFGQYF